MDDSEPTSSIYPKVSTYMVVDDLWQVFRPWGRYQLVQVPVILIGFLPVAYGMLIHVFIGYTPEFQCRNISRPLTDYGIELSNNESTYNVMYGQCQITIVENGTIGHETSLPCPNGHHFSTQQTRSTIVTEWDLVCDKQGLGELSQTLVMVGQIVGAIFLSPLPDRYGRKPVMVTGHVLAFALCVAASFSPTYAVYCVLRFLVGIVIQCLNTTVPVMCLELFSTEYRGIAGIITNTMWSTSVLSLTLFGYFLRNLSWRYIQLISALSCVLGLFSFWTLDESLRWLVANNKRDEALALVRKVASRNNVPHVKAVYLLEKILERFTITIEGDHTKDKELIESTQGDHTKDKELIESTQGGHTKDNDLTVRTSTADAYDSVDAPAPMAENERSQFEIQTLDTEGCKDNEYPLLNNSEREQTQECERTMKDNCDKNKTEKENLLKTKEKRDQEEHMSYLDVFRNKKLLRNTLVLSLCWFSTGFGYMGLFLVPFSFTHNIHINFFINAMVEFPGLFIMLILINRIGRKWLTMAFFGLAGVAIVVAVSILLLTSNSNDTTKTVGAVVMYIGKFSISCVQAMLYIYTPELYPTNVRNIGYGITGCAGRLGAMTAPFLKLLASTAEWAPGAALSATFLLALCSLLLLPETKGKELPQTLQEFVLLEKRDKKSNLCNSCTCAHSC